MKDPYYQLHGQLGDMKGLQTRKASANLERNPPRIDRDIRYMRIVGHRRHSMQKKVERETEKTTKSAIQDVKKKEQQRKKPQGNRREKCKQKKETGKRKKEEINHKKKPNN